MKVLDWLIEATKLLREAREVDMDRKDARQMLSPAWHARAARLLNANESSPPEAA